MVICLTSARFNMKADVLRAAATSTLDPDTGHWGTTQDPDSGEIIRTWINSDDKSTEENENEIGLESFPCEARGIVDGGIRVAGTTERFGSMYEGVDYVRIAFPARVRLTRRDRVTNIRDKRGTILWLEEERVDGAATVFSVTGVTPVIDPFGSHIENVALLERVEGQ